jgi:hypothetical protein
MRTREMRAGLQGHADLVRRIEALEEAVEELRKQAPRKAAAKPAEK